MQRWVELPSGMLVNLSNVATVGPVGEGSDLAGLLVCANTRVPIGLKQADFDALVAHIRTFYLTDRERPAPTTA